MFSRTLRRGYHVLAIESSCDDTCVALLDRFSPETAPRLVSHRKVSLNSTADGGVIPIKAHLHHQQHLAQLVQKSLHSHPEFHPDLVCVTRGPGMPGCLTVGLEVAKGLAVAFGKPLVGVHHMLGHLLVPRMATNGKKPEFPFLSLLVSGGHTMLVLSKSLGDHEILVETIDIAAGDALDKCARAIGVKGIMIGKELENIVGDASQYTASDRVLVLPNPLSNKAGRVDKLAYSFAPFISGINRHVDQHGTIPSHLQRQAGFDIETAIFTHIVGKIKTCFRVHGDKLASVRSLVCSGGVGANQYLRQMLENELSGFVDDFHYPEVEFCTDNATMIGWAGIEIWEGQKVATKLSGALPVRKWPLNEVFDVEGWEEVD